MQILTINIYIYTSHHYKIKLLIEEDENEMKASYLCLIIPKLLNNRKINQTHKNGMEWSKSGTPVFPFLCQSRILTGVLHHHAGNDCMGVMGLNNSYLHGENCLSLGKRGRLISESITTSRTHLYFFSL